MGMTGMHRAASVLAAMALLVLALTAPLSAQNLLPDGTFEKWNKEENQPLGWCTHMTSVIPVPDYKDPEKKEERTGVTAYKCGCGYIWGKVRPWAGLVCPKCRNRNTGLEDSGDWYLKNYECVKPVPGKNGRGAGMKLPEAVGNNQGVRILSELVPTDREAGYVISLEAMGRGSHLRVFVEGFQLMNDDKEAKEWVKTLPPEANPLKLTTRLKRGFRQQINVNTPATWTTFTERWIAPQRYQHDYVFVTLYAYLPGEAAYDNVVLRRMTSAEMEAYQREEKGPKDKRLR